MTQRIIRLVQNIALAGILFSVVSCSTPKNVTYFQDLTETVIPLQNDGVIKLEPGDRVSILVKSKDPQLAALFNLSINSNRVGDVAISPEGMASYIVNGQGNIDFPILGAIKVAGMTRDELAAYITGALRADQVRDAVVNVELLNASFTAMGEFGRTGRIPINRDRLNILEAISLAGDLGIQGKRENVAVIREESDGVHTYRIDLTNMQDVVKSPVFYIKQGDIIYVEPNDVKKRQTTVNGNNLLSWGFWVSVASLLTTVAVLIVK